MLLNINLKFADKFFLLTDYNKIRKMKTYVFFVYWKLFRNSFQNLFNIAYKFYMAIKNSEIKNIKLTKPVSVTERHFGSTL